MSEPTRTWTIADVLTWTTQSFTQKGIDSARLDAEVLLAHVLKQPRLYLYTHYDQPLAQPERDAFRIFVQRRLKREPVSLILGTREFYGLEMTLSKDVLAPRPETEHLVDAVRSWAEEKGELRIVDLGTGSGCIAIALKKFIDGAQLTAVDVSAPALAVARQNAQANAVEIRFCEGDLFAPVASEQFDVVVSNPPYIPESERQGLMPEVRDYEPALALFSGPDGLTHLRRIIDGAKTRLASPGLIALEMGAGQAPQVTAMLTAAGFSNVRTVADLAGHTRVALGER